MTQEIHVRITKEPPLWNGRAYCKTGDLGVITGSNGALARVYIRSGVSIWLAKENYEIVEGPIAAESIPAPGYDKIQAARIEGALFDFLSRNYTQTANRRQRRWGDVYMKAETHDLAREVAKFIMLNRERLLGGARCSTIGHRL